MGSLGQEKSVSAELLRTADTELLCDHRVNVKDLLRVFGDGKTHRQIKVHGCVLGVLHS